jgi:hypothetical protein
MIQLAIAEMMLMNLNVLTQERTMTQTFREDLLSQMEKEAAGKPKSDELFDFALITVIIRYVTSRTGQGVRTTTIAMLTEIIALFVRHNTPT